MGAVTSCTIGAPLTTILIVFELTSSYSLTTAVMIAVVSAMIVSGRLFPYSWFSLQLSKNGVDLSSGREVRILKQRRVVDLCKPAPTIVSSETTRGSAIAQLASEGQSHAWVVDEQGRLLGAIHLTDLVRSGESRHLSIEALIVEPEFFAEQSSDLDTTLQRLRRHEGDGIPVVVDRQSMRLTGVVHEGDLLSSYADAVAQAREEHRGQK